MKELENTELIDKELIFLDYEVKNKEELIEKMVNYAEEKGYVKETFLDAVLKRECVFPTGLKGEKLTIAIPHTDSGHVIKPGIFFARVKNSVIFKEMGLGINDIEVKLIFMLFIKNPKEQINMLSNLMKIFKQEDRAKILLNSANKNEVYKTLVEIIE